MEPRFGAITATDRLDQFIEFCDSWFEGDKSRRNLRNLDIDAALQGCPIEIPSTLVQFYWAARNWPWKRAFSRGQDHLLGPAEIGRDNPMAEHGLLLIARENQKARFQHVESA